MSATLKALKLSNANILISFETEAIKSLSEIEVFILCETSVASMHQAEHYFYLRSWCVLLKNNGTAVVWMSKSSSTLHKGIYYIELALKGSCYGKHLDDSSIVLFQMFNCSFMGHLFRMQNQIYSMKIEIQLETAFSVGQNKFTK
jgi:hypothetical protein